MKLGLRSLLFSLALTLTATVAAHAGTPPSLPNLPIPQNMGVAIHFGPNDQLQANISYLQELGIGMVRTDLTWSDVEKTKGVYDFSSYDTVVNALRSANIKVMLILDYANRLYDGGDGPLSDEGRAAFAKFAVAAVNHYGSKVSIWEMYNEPNIGFWKPEPSAEQYIALANEATAAIRQAAPGTVIVGPALAGPNLTDIFVGPDGSMWKETYGYLKTVLGSPAAHDWSAITIHPYRRGTNQTPESVAGQLDNIRALMREKGIDTPLVAGEWGFATFSKGIDEATQAAYAVRTFLVAGIQHMPFTVWYDWQDDGNDNTNQEHRFGLLRHGTLWSGQDQSRSTKPAFLAVQQLISLLKGYSFDSLIENDTVIIARYVKGSQAAYAVWSADNAPHMANVALPAGNWTVNHILDAAKNLTATAGKNTQVAAQKMPMVLLPAQ